MIKVKFYHIEGIRLEDICTIDYNKLQLNIKLVNKQYNNAVLAFHEFRIWFFIILLGCYKLFNPIFDYRSPCMDSGIVYFSQCEFYRLDWLFLLWDFLWSDSFSSRHSFLQYKFSIISVFYLFMDYQWLFILLL